MTNEPIFCGIFEITNTCGTAPTDKENTMNTAAHQCSELYVPYCSTVLKVCDSLYSVAVQSPCDVETVAALHGSDSGLHDSRRAQHWHSGVCRGEVAIPLEPCLWTETCRDAVEVRYYSQGYTADRLGNCKNTCWNMPAWILFLIKKKIVHFLYSN